MNDYNIKTAQNFIMNVFCVYCILNPLLLLIPLYVAEWIDGAKRIKVSVLLCWFR